MKLKRILAFSLIFLIMSALPLKVMAEDKKTQHVILIDAGHGGIDGGAKSKNGTIEKEINLAIASKLKEKLSDSGYKVYMTREDDIELDKRKAEDLSKRCKMKDETECEVFISIHQNMFPQAKCFGAQVWYASNDKSKELAEGVQESLKEHIKDNNKRVAKAAKEQYKILRDGYDGACIIVECGFLSNYEEEQRLKTDEHQENLVEAIKCGLDKYFEGK
ncbi:N-acetylmuramoyl-L-alanine amidase [uncultured Clostridium sp.]|uniref:N-acetylmuramoyl-L-alanine amidase n=1 Tax=uncultured Clostridium sp. TaxID=59620 RepID=UPI0025F06799|nr:N-acetylmuramoyl-L-alanine amidase [uncultured Clostridium sp.]